MNMQRQEHVKFSTVLDTLMDDSRPFPPVYLHQFSDLSPTRLHSLTEIWPRIKNERRRSFLSDLEDLAENDTLVSFGEVGRMALNDSDAQVRTLAIRLLWEAEDVKLVPIFIRMLENDPDSVVRATAANGLGAYVYLGEIENLSPDMLESIEESLFKAYQSKDQSLIVRRRALESLGYSSRSEVPAMIKAAYNNGSVDWLESALFAMGRSADQSYAPAVLKQLDHPNPNIQYEAVRAAGELQLEGARPRLLSFLDEAADDQVRTAAIWSLSQIGGEGVRVALEGLMDETEDEEEMDIIEEALDNLSFTEDMALFDMFDVDMEEGDRSIIDLDRPSSSDDGDETDSNPSEDAG